jgi:hypothetical protein
MDATGRCRSSSRSWVGALPGTRSLPRPTAWGMLFALLLLSLAMPAAAQVASPSEQDTTLSVSDRLDDRRYVATGTRGYIVGTEDGRFPAMGWHIKGEMGGIWSPPIKLLDGLWFGIDGQWLGEANTFTSGYGFVQMDGIEAPEGLTVRRTDFVPDDKRGALVGLEVTSQTDRQISLTVDAHSELMSAYPWEWTTPSASDYNLEDTAAYADGRLEFREQGTPPVQNAEAHNWAAVVGSQLTPAAHATGEDFRGPQDPAVICPTDSSHGPCDDSASGKGAGGQLSYDVPLEAGQPHTIWVAVAGSEQGPASAHSELDTLLANPESALGQKVSERLEVREKTQLNIPGDQQLEESIDWSKQNLADSVQVAEDLQIRETDEGRQYPPPEGTIDRVRFLGAGFPDYPWLFGTDGEFTAFASVGVGQFEPIKDHLRALKEASLIDNTPKGGEFSGKVVHEVVTDGSIYFGSDDDAGNTDETAKFPSAVALIWRWSGDNAFRDEMYGFSKSNMEYIFRELDEDNDGWPEGLGNVERAGMGEEKLDVTTSTIRGLYDLADMARSKGDTATAEWAMQKAQGMQLRFEDSWWFGQEGATQYADSLRNPNNEKVFQRHWIGVTPMEIELTNQQNRAVPGLANYGHGRLALAERELSCYTDAFGMYHTGTGPTAAAVGNPGPSCDRHVSEVPSERSIFTLNTAVMAVGEGNYGRLGPDQQQHYTDANADLQFIPDEQPGAMPEIAPSPDYGRSIDRHFTDRAMVLQAWGAYGTIWPVVHQHLGVRPDMGRSALEVVPQVPPQYPKEGLSGKNIRLGSGSVDVSASVPSNSTYQTIVRPNVSLQKLTVGHTVARDAKVVSVTLNEDAAPYEIRETNRGKEVLVQAATSGEQQLVVTTQ